MNHKSIYEAYKIKLPKYADGTMTWTPHDKHSIRVRLINKQAYVFTFESDACWSFETLKHYKNRTKK